MKKLFRLPEMDDFVDYKKSIHLAIFTVYALILILVMTFSSNPMYLAYYVSTLMFFVLLYLFSKVLINDIKAFGKNFKRYLPFILVGFILCVFLNVLGGNITAWIGAGDIPNQEAAESAFWQTPLLGAFAKVIVAPISEELMFRRSIRVMVKNKVLYYLLSMFLFGMAHLIIGFTFPSSFAFIFLYALTGLGFAFVYDKSNNIWCAIFVHILVNGLGVIMLLVS